MRLVLPGAVRPALASAALPLAAGAVTVQLALGLTRPAPVLETTLLTVNATLGGILAALFLRLAWTMAAGAPHALREGRRLLVPNAAVVLAVALVPLTVLLWDQPARLALTLYCFTLLAGTAWWIVRRAAGPWAAAGAVGGLAALALVGASADRPSMRLTQDWRRDSAFRWTVGWPTEAWRLRHTVALAAPAPERPLRLRLFLAGSYSGHARVYATVNGRDVAVALTESELQVEVPPALTQGAPQLDLVLRQAPPDPRLRLLASRWSQGAGLGGAATEYSDSQGHTWLPGTFNDGAGRRQAGVLALHVEESPG